MSPTEQYINVLTNLKAGELGLLRTHALQGIDGTVEGFDLFTGLWWPLRQKNQKSPRREVAWLIAKIYASRPIEHSQGDLFARQIGQCRPAENKARKRFQQKFDRMLTLPLEKIEPALRWAVDVLASQRLRNDWVKLTDDLSIWERESTRLKWAEDFLDSNKGGL